MGIHVGREVGNDGIISVRVTSEYKIYSIYVILKPSVLLKTIYLVSPSIYL